MKYRERDFYITLLILLTAFISHKGPMPAECSTSAARQTVSVTFPAIRNLYVDDHNNIVAILNNSPVISDEMLAVYRNGLEMPLYNDIKDQYDEILDEIDFSRVGWVYKGSFRKQQLKNQVACENERQDESLTYLEQIICNEIQTSNVFQEVSGIDNEKCKFPPSAPPHKGHYSVRMTVFDVEQNERGVSVTSL